ncbi:hypothetical protein VB005_11644 [Metarhizium brunneum]
MSWRLRTSGYVQADIPVVAFHLRRMCPLIHLLSRSPIEFSNPALPSPGSQTNIVPIQSRYRSPIFFQGLRSIALVLVPVRQLPWACSNEPHFENAGEAYCHNDAPQLAENAVNGGGTSQQAPLKKLGNHYFGLCSFPTFGNHRTTHLPWRYTEPGACWPDVPAPRFFLPYS